MNKKGENENTNLEEIVNTISQEAKLNSKDKEFSIFLLEEMILHDLKNLRGDEWLDFVEENCSKSTIRKFKNILRRFNYEF